MSFKPTSLLRRTLIAASLSGFAALPLIAAAAETVNFAASLSAAAEVPVNTSTAIGALVATLDKGTNELSWMLTYSDLSGAASAAHFHGPAMPGANAGVVVPFTSAASGSTGKAMLTPAQVADLMAGKWYANVHTAANPGGEIRGQLLAK